MHENSLWSLKERHKTTRNWPIDILLLTSYVGLPFEIYNTRTFSGKWFSVSVSLLICKCWLERKVTQIFLRKFSSRIQRGKLSSLIRLVEENLLCVMKMFFHAFEWFLKLRRKGNLTFSDSQCNVWLEQPKIFFVIFFFGFHLYSPNNTDDNEKTRKVIRD